ncbi:MAG: hypothetical protein KIT73_00500 [Burkholderiales bacterium]|nr:hypothetical protein [Burkholderiales bacterium]
MGLAIVSALVAISTHAQERSPQPRGELIDWTYASTFGTGIYNVGGRTVTVFRVPFSHRLRMPDDDQWGIRLKAPVTVGLYSLDRPIGDLFDDNFATVSVLPGIEFEKEILPNWTLRPTVSYGLGQDVIQGNWSQIWEIGARSLYRIPLRQSELSISNAMLYSGNRASDGVRQNYGVFATGFNFIVPTGKRLLDRPSNIGVHLIHYLFFNQVDFFLQSEGRKTVAQQYEVAFSFGTYTPIKVLGIDFDRIGVGFRTGQDFYAIRIFTDFIF